MIGRWQVWLLWCGAILVLTEWFAAEVGEAETGEGDTFEQIPQDELPKLISEMEQAWSNAIERQKYVSARFVETSVLIDKGQQQVTSQGETHYKSRSDSFVLIKDITRVFSEDERAGSEPAVQVLGRNDKYYFELSALHPEGPYRLTRYHRITANDNNRDLARLELQASGFVYRGFKINAVPLPEMLRKGSVKITSARRHTDNGQRLVTLTVEANDVPGSYSYRFPSGIAVHLPYFDHQNARPLPFAVTVAPEHEYRLVRVEGMLREFDWAKYEVVYVLDDNGMTRLIQSTYQPTGDSQHIRQRIREYLEWSEQPPHRSEFYLTAFGLPEPVDLQTRQGRSLFWWLAAAGLTCIVIGFGLWRWYEWHQQKNKAA